LSVVELRMSEIQHISKHFCVSNPLAFPMQVRDIDNIRSVDTIRTATRDNQSPCHFAQF
jgi:hypothetical protein